MKDDELDLVLIVLFLVGPEEKKASAVTVERGKAEDTVLEIRNIAIRYRKQSSGKIS